MSPAVRQRLSADERRTQVVQAAIRRFAVGGYSGTSTEDIARDVELSQPYLFRLFRTKRDLFLACCEVSYQEVGDLFAAAVEGKTFPDVDTTLEAMGEAYSGFLQERDLLRFQLQMYAAAAADEEIRVPVRQGFKALASRIRELSGAPEERLWTFFAHGMLLNTIASMDFKEIADEDEWAAAWCEPSKLTA